MPLTSSDLATLNSKIADAAAFASGLVADPAVNPLQTALDAANAQVISLSAQVSTVSAQLAATNDALAAEQTLDAALLAKIQKAQSDLA